MDYEKLHILCGHIKRKSDNTSCVVFMRTGRQSTPDFLLVSYSEDNRVEYYHYFKSSIDAYNAYVRKAEGGRAREVGSKESSAMSYFLKEGGSSVRARDPIAIEETMGLIHTRRFFVEHRLLNWAKAWDERALEQKANAAIEQAFFACAEAGYRRQEFDKLEEGSKAVARLEEHAKEALYAPASPMHLIGASLVTGNNLSCLSMWANDKGEIKILAGGLDSTIYQGNNLSAAKEAAFTHINTCLALAEREGKPRLIDELRKHQLPISNMFDGFYINRNKVVISEFAQELLARGERELWEFLQDRKLDVDPDYIEATQLLRPQTVDLYELAERKYTTMAKPEPPLESITQGVNTVMPPPLFQGRPLTKAEASLLDKHKAEIEEAEARLLDKYKAEIEETEALQVVKAMEEALNHQRKEAEVQAKELMAAKGRLSKIRKGQKKKAAIVQTMSLSAIATLMVYLIISRVFGRPVPALKLNAPNKLKKKRRRRDHQEESPVREAIALPAAKGEEIPTQARRRTKAKV